MKIFLMLVGVTALIDLTLFIVMFVYYETKLEYYLVIFDGLCTFMLYTISLYIFSIDIGKIELLRNNRNIFGSILCFMIATSYLLYAVVFMNLQLIYP